MHHPVNTELGETYLLSNKQFGFRKGISTTTALTSFADEVLLNMEQGKLLQGRVHRSNQGI